MVEFNDRRPHPPVTTAQTGGDIAGHLAWNHEMHHVEIDAAANGHRGAYKLAGRMSKTKAVAAHAALHAQGADHTHQISG